MKLRTEARFALFAALLLVIDVATTGCRARKPASPASDAAIVPNADIVCRIDNAALRNTPIVVAMRALRDEQEKNDPLAGARAARRNRIEEALGLSGDQILGILLTANSSTLNVKNLNRQEEMKKLAGVMAVDLAKPVSMDQLRAAMTVLNEEKSNAKVIDTVVGDTPAILIDPTDPNEPPLYAARSPDGRTLYLAVNETSLADALRRQKTGRNETWSPAMASVQTSIPKDAQIQVLFIAPESIRESVRDRIAAATKDPGQNPGAAITVNLIRPLATLKSVSLAGAFAQQADIGITVELGSETDASQIASMLQALGLPLLRGWVGQIQQPGAAPLFDSIKVSAAGPKVVLSMAVTANDLSSTPAAP